MDSRGLTMADENAEKPAGKRKLGLAWILLGVVGLIAAAGFGFQAFKYFKGADAKPAAGAIEKVEATTVQSTLNLEPFLVNLADEGQAHFVKASFQLGLSEKEAGKVLAADPVFLAAARDSIISLLTVKSAGDILTSAGKDLLRQEIQERVNSLMPQGKVQQVYIVDFVVQL